MATVWEDEPPAREPEDAAQKRARVLVAAPEAPRRRALAQVFASGGFAVASAASRADALAACESRAYDLVAIELSGSEREGLALCEQLRARPRAGELPILVIGAADDGAAFARALEAGASDFASGSEPLAAVVHRARVLVRARRSGDALRKSEARLREAQQLAQLAGWRYELDSRALTGDPELWRVLGVARGARPRLEPADLETLAAHVRDCLRSGRVATGEVRARGDDGAERRLRYRMQLALGEEGEPIALEGVVQDVSAWRRAEQRASYLADHDPVTNLANRSGLQQRLSQRAVEARAAGHALGVLAFGLGGFERVAATLGRESADALLAEAARRLASALPGCELAHARDAHFVALAREAGDPAALEAAAQRALDALDAPIRGASHELLLAPSAGIARFPSDGDDPNEVLRCAERALAQAQRGGARVQAHSAESSAAALRRLALAGRLRGAIARGELALLYQPKIALASGEIAGFEGLVRWREPELGTLSPAEFVPIAEEFGLIGELGDWVVREACRQIVAWRSEGLGDVPIAVNLSPQQFRREGVAARIAQILRETGASPALLGIEVTESVLLEDADCAIRELNALRALGCELALDDFGTGFSSLSVLRKLPVQIVKIDREFISEISTREDAAALTAGVVAMAKSLWLRVVAEGVEKEAERELVAIWGCDEAQGYLFSMPVPADSASHLWRERGARSATGKPPG
jgi:diguanylate cyclase (GGDEF)-like protein